MYSTFDSTEAARVSRMLQFILIPASIFRTISRYLYLRKAATYYICLIILWHYSFDRICTKQVYFRLQQKRFLIMKVRNRSHFRLPYNILDCQPS